MSFNIFSGLFLPIKVHTYIRSKVRKIIHLVTIFSGVGGAQVNEQTLDNLCGDLNKGYLPLNPIGQNVEGVSYPL